MIKFEVGEVREPKDFDFDIFIKLCDDHSEFEEVSNKNDIAVYVKPTTYSSFKMFKIRAVLDVNALVLYNTLHDSEYRPKWDKNLIEGFQICQLENNSDIGYYAMKSPLAFKNRDFVTQRCWRVKNNEYTIFNHSVFHKAQPPKKNFVRGISFITGYLMRPISPSKTELTYITQSNPRGSIPSWAINKAAKIVVPKIVNRFLKASINYPSWKNTNNPDFMPWNKSGSWSTPFINWNDILHEPDIDITLNVDENHITENYNDNGDMDID